VSSGAAEVKDPKSYTVYGLYVAGSRFSDDYDQDDAVEHYLELHPEADAAAVRAELSIAIAKS
jgi:hypothetical protein